MKSLSFAAKINSQNVKTNTIVCYNYLPCKNHNDSKSLFLDCLLNQLNCQLMHNTSNIWRQPINT